MAADGPQGAPPTALRPVDAATLIVIDDAGGVPRILMGRRRLDLVFMPGKYVFPGGRVDVGDRTVAAADDLDPSELGKLLAEMRGRPSDARARALALAAVRETFEEAGLVVGSARGEQTHPAPAEWSGFIGLGYVPRVAPLTFFARAITPPGRPRRFDTRFFCAHTRDIAHRVEIGDGELIGLDWFTLDQISSLELPPITRVVVEDLVERLECGPLGPSAAPVPFYHHRHGAFRRDLLRLD